MEVTCESAVLSMFPQINLHILLFMGSWECESLNPRYYWCDRWNQFWLSPHSAQLVQIHHPDRLGLCTGQKSRTGPVECLFQGAHFRTSVENRQEECVLELVRGRSVWFLPGPPSGNQFPVWHWFNALQEKHPVGDLQRSHLQCQTQERVLPLHLPALPHPSCWLVLLQKPDGWSWRLLQAVRPRGTFKRPPVQPTGSTRNSPGDNLSTLFLLRPQPGAQTRLNYWCFRIWCFRIWFQVLKHPFQAPSPKRWLQNWTPFSLPTQSSSSPITTKA